MSGANIKQVSGADARAAPAMAACVLAIRPTRALREAQILRWQARSSLLIFRLCLRIKDICEGR